MGEVRLDGEKNDQIAFQARTDYQNHAIGQLRRENHYNGCTILE